MSGEGISGRKPDERPSDHPFKQQKLNGWTPLLTHRPVIACFLFFGLVLVILGPIVLVQGTKVIETKVVEYDKYALGTNFTINIEVTTRMAKPVYMYYVLTNFYGMHRRFVKSRNDDQLSGPASKYPKTYRSIIDCEPLAAQYPASDPASQQPKNFYFPCGLVPWARFNDTFQNFIMAGSNTTIELEKKNIAWADDIKTKYHNPEGTPPGVLPPGNTKLWDFQDQDFMVWMRGSASPKFRNLYRVINMDLEPGTYTLLVQNEWGILDVKKGILLSTLGPLGGRNQFLGGVTTLVGVLTLAFAFVAIIKWKFYSKQTHSRILSQWFGREVPRPVAD